jgi:hypothetical protein
MMKDEFGVLHKEHRKTFNFMGPFSRRKQKEATMDVTTTITLTQDEETEIARILGCTVGALQATINFYAGAALKEYLTMIRGQKVFKRGSDILEYRLFLLIESAFHGTIPDEQKVCSLFQTTLTESRSLIRAVISKYQYQLKASIENTMRQVLANANRENAEADYSVVINSHNIVDELNRLLAEIDGNLTPVTKKKGSVSTYEIKPSSYIRLNTRLDPQHNQ